MSKILINSEELHNLISQANEVIYSTPYVHPYTNQAKKASEILDVALDLIEKQEFEQRRFSVLEWHGFDETPESGKVILMLWNDGTIDTVYPSDEWPALKSVRAWAYLPE